MQKKLLTNGNVFKRTDGRWNGVVWYQWPASSPIVPSPETHPIEGVPVFYSKSGNWQILQNFREEFVLFPVLTFETEAL